MQCTRPIRRHRSTSTSTRTSKTRAVGLRCQRHGDGRADRTCRGRPRPERHARQHAHHLPERQWRDARSTVRRRDHRYVEGCASAGQWRISAARARSTKAAQGRRLSKLTRPYQGRQHRKRDDPHGGPLSHPDQSCGPSRQEQAARWHGCLGTISEYPLMAWRCASRPDLRPATVPLKAFVCSQA